RHTYLRHSSRRPLRPTDLGRPWGRLRRGRRGGIRSRGIGVRSASWPPTSAGQSIIAHVDIIDEPALCIGTCNGSAAVAIDEIIILVNIARGEADISTCSAGIAGGVDQITAGQIIAAITNALSGCP